MPIASVNSRRRQAPQISARVRTSITVVTGQHVTTNT